MSYFNRNAGHVGAARVVDTHALQFEIQPSTFARGYKCVKGAMNLFYHFPGAKALASQISRSIGYQEVKFRGQILSINWDQEILLNDFKRDAEHFLRKEFKTAEGYEIHPKNGQFVVMSRIGNTAVEVQVKTPELQGFLDQMQSTWNDILKDNMCLFLQMNKGKLIDLYTNTRIPAGGGGGGRRRGGGGVNYNKAQATARVAALLAKRPDGAGGMRDATALEMIDSLKADGILNASGSCLTTRAELRSTAVELEKFTGLYQYLNEAVPEAGLAQGVAQNLAARMRHRRTRYIGTWLCPIPVLSNGYAMAKKISYLYRKCTGKRIMTVAGMPGTKGTGPAEKLLDKWNDAERALFGVSDAEKTAAIEAVENHKNGVAGAVRPTPRQNNLHKAIRTIDALSVIHEADPEFKLIKEMFVAYHEGLAAVSHKPEKCGERMRRAMDEMINKLAVKRKAGIGAGHRYKAGSKVTVTKEDKQQIYRLFSYVLPLDEERIGPRETVWRINQDILDEYMAIGEEDDELAEVVPAEQDFIRVAEMQNVLWD